MGTQSGTGTPDAWWNGTNWYYGPTPPGQARGTNNATGAFLTGDSESGQRTGWEELVVTTGKAKVYNRRDTARILAQRGGWQGARYPYGTGQQPTPDQAIGSQVYTGTASDYNFSATIEKGVNPGPYVPSAPYSPPGISSGSNSSQAMAAAVAAAAATTQVAAATTTVAAAAATISASGQQTAQATQQGTVRAAQDAATIVGKLDQMMAELRRLQESTVGEMKKLKQ